jgi:hypothetical protein
MTMKRVDIKTTKTDGPDATASVGIPGLSISMTGDGALVAKAMGVTFQVVLEEHVRREMANGRSLEDISNELAKEFTRASRAAGVSEAAIAD